MTTPADVVAAEARATAARERLNGTVEQLQVQLAPKKLAREAVDSATEGAQSMARASIKTAMRNPSTVTGGAAVLILILCRRPLGRALGLIKRAPSAAQPAHLRHVR